MAVPPDDPEQNRLSGRLTRYARVGAGVGGAAARIAGARLFGRDLSDPRNATDIALTLGGLKGPLMKVAQMMATIPDLLPPDYAAELQKLQAGLAEPLRQLRAHAGGRRLARPGPQGGRP
jgi:predicted unusual protein kinase regulating ubiquinone biosynthesis (AarF/ABC1/UbiB family)